MSGQESNLREMITRQMQSRSTEELLEIWRENDQEAWTEVGLEVVAEILLQRRGYAFEHNEPLQTALEEEQSPEIYHSPKALIRTAGLAEVFSWIVLAVFLIRFVASIIDQFALRSGPGLLLNPLLPSPWLEVLRDGSALAVGVFFALVLQALSQIIYFGMDIYEEIQLARSQADPATIEQEAGK